jgi:hypothetical protein
LMVAHLEWPDMVLPRIERTLLAQDTARGGDHGDSLETDAGEDDYTTGIPGRGRRSTSKTALVLRLGESRSLER